MELRNDRIAVLSERESAVVTTGFRDLEKQVDDFLSSCTGHETSTSSTAP